MARLVINAQNLEATGAYPALPVTPGSAEFTFTGTSDQTDRYTALVNNKTMVIAQNTDSVDQTITFTSVVDPFNRVGNITTYNIPAGKTVRFGRFQTVGWAQISPAGLWINVSDAKVILAVVTLP